MSEFSDDDRALLIRIDERQRSFVDRLEMLETEVKEIRNQANRWKGGFVVILAVGSIVGWLLGQYAKFTSLIQ